MPYLAGHLRDHGRLEPAQPRRGHRPRAPCVGVTSHAYVRVKQPGNATGDRCHREAVPGRPEHRPDVARGLELRPHPAGRGANSDPARGHRRARAPVLEADPRGRRAVARQRVRRGRPEQRRNRERRPVRPQARAARQQPSDANRRAHPDPRGRRRVRRGRGMGLTEQRQRHLRSTPESHRRLRLHRRRLARRQASAVPGRPHRRRPSRRGGIRRRRGVGVAEQRQRHLRSAPESHRRLRLHRRRLAGRQASAVPGRPHRRRSRRRGGIRRRRGVGVAEQRQRHLRRPPEGRSPTSATPRATGGSTSIRGSWPTSPATAAPTWWDSATAGCGCR